MVQPLYNDRIYILSVSSCTFFFFNVLYPLRNLDDYDSPYVALANAYLFQYILSPILHPFTCQVGDPLFSLSIQPSIWPGTIEFKKKTRPSYTSKKFQFPLSDSEYISHYILSIFFKRLLRRSSVPSIVLRASFYRTTYSANKLSSTHCYIKRRLLQSRSTNTSIFLTE